MRGMRRHARSVVVLGSIAGLLMSALPAGGWAGNAGVQVTKTVDSTSITPALGLTLAVDKSTGIPGDRLTYSGQVTNTGATFGINGHFLAGSHDDATATVASYFDQVELCTQGCGDGLGNPHWVPFVGFSAVAPGYTPQTPPDVSTGLTLTATPVAASGVTYSTGADTILGTQIGPGAVATWAYSATIALTPAQVAMLSTFNPTESTRNTIHFEVINRNTNAAEPWTDVVTFTNPFQAMADPAAISNVTVTVTPPSGAALTVNSSTVPGLALLKPGTSASYSAPFTIPVPAAKGSAETDASYLARLTALEGAALSATATASGTAMTGGATITAPAPPPVATTEHLPILAISKSGPPQVGAGTTEVNPLGLQNSGGAPASGLAVADTVPAGASGAVTGVPASLGPGASAPAEADFPVPLGQPAGGLTDTASLTWHDANGNAYGPVSNSFTTTVLNTLSGALLTLAPAAAGPNPTGTSQKLTATLVDRTGAPIASQALVLAITGANPGSLNGTTDATGAASFTYTGANRGADVAQATASSGPQVVQSNTSTVNWITPPVTISSTPVQGNFFAEPASATTFVARPGDTPAFGQTFPNVEFNPPAGIVNHNVSNVGPSTRPFTDVTTDSAGNFTGTIVAQGDGVAAGTGSLSSFDAELTSSFVVARAGDVTFNVIADDGFLLGVGGGASRVSGAYENAPASNTAPFTGLNLVGAFDEQGGAAPQTFPVTVHFPAAGTYPYELDYFECCGLQLSLTLTVATFTADTSPLSVYVGYADGLRPAGSIFPFPWQGSAGVGHFIGSGATAYDSGAIRFDNNSDSPITLGDVSVDIGSTHFDLWGSTIPIDPHSITILTQTFGNNFDTSDQPITCTPTHVTPQVHVTQAGVTTTFADTQQVLNTKGIDPPSCGGGNESIAWTRIGGSGSTINVPLPAATTLTLSPTTVAGDVVGTAQSLTVAALDGSGQGVPGLPVTVQVFGANTQQLTGTTDVTGTVHLSYVGAAAGTDVVDATAFVSGLRSVSNALKVPWNIPVPGPGGAPSGGTPQQAPPAIGGQSPADGTVVTKPIPITATFTPPAGETIASWSVTAQAAHGGTPITLASGTGTPPSPLATFDPTAVVNDTYAITTTATASGGGVQSSTTTVSVQGDLKPGRYTTSYRDVDVPVQGFEMQVDRAYDSTDKRVGDFGVGWHVDVANFRVSSNGPLGGGGDWTEYPTSCFLLCFYAFRSANPHDVTVTYPDGRQEIFDFTPAGGVGPFYWLGNAAFTARPGTGTTSTLQVAGDTSLVSGFDGTILNGLGGTVYNPTRFVLKTQGGEVLTLDTVTGLVSAQDPNGNTVTIASTGIHASNGESVAFARDAQNRITTITEPNGRTIGYTYTASGDLGSVAYPNGTSLTYTYDSAHDLLSTTGTGGLALSTLQYDASGRLVAVIDGAGNRTAISNDVAGQKQITTSPSGRLTTIDTFDDRGDTVRKDLVGDGTTLTTTATYDSLGRMLTTTEPNGHTRSFTYDTNGLLTSASDFNGNVQHYVYSAAGQLTTVTAPDGTVLDSLSYDAGGNVVRETRPDGSFSTFTYDAAGDLLSVTDAAGRSLHYTYDATGHLASSTDPLGNRSTVVVDPNGLVTSITDPLGGTGRLGYDADGNLTSIIDELGNTQSYSYDAFDRITSTVDGLGGTSANTYDAAGRLASSTDRNGGTITYTYDADGRVIGKTVAGDSPDTYTYDAFGDVTGASNATAQLSLTYDPAGNLTSRTSAGTATSPLPTVTYGYTYDANGDRLSRSGPDGTLSYTYDSNLRLHTLTDASGGTFTFTYDSLGRLTALQRPNGVADSLAYDPSGDLTSRDATGPGGLVGRADYTFNNYGQRTSLTDPGGTSSFTYDADGQVTSATHPAASGLPNESYQYDLAGNRTGSATSPAGSMTYNGDNELTRDAGSTYTYDAEGNLVTTTARSGGATSTYHWDAEHRLTSATLPGGGSATYRYDPFGSLVETDQGSGITRYAYDGPNVGAEFDGGNALTASYVQGDVPFTQMEMTRGGQRYFYLVDGLGSTTALTDASGNVVQRYAYDSYGNVTGGGAVVNPFQFTGQLLDPSTGLYSTPLREYDPALGRWLSQDPLPAANRYPYVANDPVNLTDPSGAQDAEEEATLDAQAASLARTGTGKIEVYYARTASNKCYFGITGRGLGTRLAEHNANGKNFVDIVKITETFSRGEARVVEQFLIDNGGGLARNGGKLLNIINSVADGSPLFNLAVNLSSQFLAASAVLTSLASICV